MRHYRISFALLLCLSVSGLSGQFNITGKVNHPADTVVTLMVPPTSLGGESRNLSSRLSAGNEFHFAVSTNIATPAEIVHGGARIRIFIIPDRSFSIEFTAAEREANAILFTGPGGADNTFFHEYLQFLEVEAPPVDSSQLARSTARKYRRLMDQNRAARELFLETYSQTAERELAPQLLQWLRNDIAYTYATELLRYPSVFRKLHKGTKNRYPSAGYYAFLEGIPVNNPDAILQDSYQRFLESFVTYKLKKPMEWRLQTGGEYQYSMLNRFFIGPSLYYMQYLVFERTLNWLIKPDYMAGEYRSFMASKAPVLLKQKLKKLREDPPKFYSSKSFRIIGGPVLWDVFQFQNGTRPDTAFFQGRPTLLYFHDWHLSRVDFAINYLKKLKRKLEAHPDMNICLVDVNGNFEKWQRAHSESGDAEHPITHLSMNYFDKLFDPLVEQGNYPNMVIADEQGKIVETLNWKPPVKRVVEIINRKWK